jgi:hypothetical protein
MIIGARVTLQVRRHTPEGWADGRVAHYEYTVDGITPVEDGPS